MTVSSDELPPSEVANDVAAVETQSDIRALLVRVYGLMCAGLLLTASVSYWVASSPEIVEHLQMHPSSYYVLFWFEVALVGLLAKLFDNFSPAAAAVTFVCYAALNGLSFSVFFLFLPPMSIAFGFLVTALTFAALGLYGYYTLQDLGRLKNVARMAITGLAIMTVANLLLRTSTAYWATSYSGVLLFSGLLAYHSDDIRDMEYSFEDDNGRWKAAIGGALLLYLDFMNLYLLLVSASQCLNKSEE